jgi:hypothetical protein
MENTHMGNLYHIMNIAFLLIEEEREQYVDVIERTKEQGIRGRVVAVHVISGMFKRFQSSLLNWSFKIWAKLSREHQAWLAANHVRKKCQNARLQLPNGVILLIDLTPLTLLPPPHPRARACPLQSRVLRSQENERRLEAAKNAINRIRNGLKLRCVSTI